MFSLHSIAAYLLYFLTCFFVGRIVGTLGTSLGVPLVIQMLSAIPLAFLMKKLFKGVI